MLPAEVQAVIRKPEKLRPGGAEDRGRLLPILRIDGDKLTEAMPEDARKRYRELNNS